MKHEITVEKKYVEKVEVPIPSFWKTQSEFNEGNKTYLAILDHDTVVKIWSIEDRYTAIHNGAADFMESEIREAVNNYHDCSEEEFFQAFKDAYESLRLTPVLNIASPVQEGLDNLHHLIKP